MEFLQVGYLPPNDANVRESQNLKKPKNVFLNRIARAIVEAGDDGAKK